MDGLIFYYYFNQTFVSEAFPKDEYIIFIIPDIIVLLFIALFTILYIKKYNQSKDNKNIFNLVIAYVFFVAAFIMQSVVNFFILFDFTENTIFNFIEYQFLALVILGCIPLALFYNDFESDSLEQFNFILIIGIILIFWLCVSPFFLPQSKWIMYIPFIITSFFNSALINYYTKDIDDNIEKENGEAPKKSKLSNETTVP